RSHNHLSMRRRNSLSPAAAAERQQLHHLQRKLDMARLGENRYGKSRVRLSRITRRGDVHEFNEWTVEVLLHGDFDASFTAADNSKILPTDTMKNTAYFIARGSKAETIEEFAKELGDHLLGNNPHVSQVNIDVAEKQWERMHINGASEPTTFKLGGP